MLEKGVLKNLVKFTGKHLCQNLFFNEVKGLRLQFLLKKRLWHRCFPVNFAKCLRAPFLQNIRTTASEHCTTYYTFSSTTFNKQLDTSKINPRNHKELDIRAIPHVLENS